MEYLSKERYDSIVAELDNLIGVEYPKVKDALSEARAQGDLSENCGYRAARTAQAKMTFTIVSPHEMDLERGKISLKSPIGAALMGKKAGDVVEVHAPAGTMRLRIEDVRNR